MSPSKLTRLSIYNKYMQLEISPSIMGSDSERKRRSSVRVVPSSEHIRMMDETTKIISENEKVYQVFPEAYALVQDIIQARQSEMHKEITLAKMTHDLALEKQ